MTIEPEMLMAYADGALDPLNAKRVERAITENPALADEVERHRRLKARLASAYAPVADEPVPDRLAAILTGNVVPMQPPLRQRSRLSLPLWKSAAAMAASLVVGVLLGRQVDRGPISATDHGLYAAGSLASALDRQASGGDGAVRIAVSFRATDNEFCRVFQSAAADGIACRDRKGWALRRTMPGTTPKAGGYAQAGSSDAELMAAAQDMMADMPLDAEGEKAAVAKDWRNR
ncbi:anti-sigma factor family protein [Sphingomonas sp. 2378]|uniref:anti-sigma factor family protein n=1 Tax=Sphingomonas sp. 2378 TaxID=1219748 RepID=UPI00311B0CC4